jgi:general L-amino acid transport system substrate-binding protein
MFVKLIVCSLLILPVAQASTLAVVKKNGHLRCGVSTGLMGFSSPDDKGEWRGLDVDICRAVAAAVLGDKNKVKFISLNAQQRFTALQSGEIDILSRNTTVNLSRDSSTGMNFAPVVFYDGQGFMVRKKDGIKSALQLAGASICTQQGTTTELNMADFFRSRNLKFKPVVFDSNEETNLAFFKGRCDALTTDSSGLASERMKMKNPTDYVILPEIISKEPLAPAVRHGDDEWFDVVKWVIYALIESEELQLSSKSVNGAKNSQDPRVQRLLGVTAGNGKALGLSEDWAFKIISQVGNYAEIYHRNVGDQSPLKIPRGLNRQWSDGGLLYAPPVR